MKENQPALDADKIDGPLLMDYFRLPPKINKTISRSTLLIGTRGSGKTMYLRILRRTHTGTALFGDITKICRPIDSDTGTGRLSINTIPPSLEISVQNKTIAFLSLWFSKTM